MWGAAGIVVFLALASQIAWQDAWEKAKQKFAQITQPAIARQEVPSVEAPAAPKVNFKYITYEDYRQMIPYIEHNNPNPIIAEQVQKV